MYNFGTGFKVTLCNVVLFRQDVTYVYAIFKRYDMAYAIGMLMNEDPPALTGRKGETM